MIKIIDYKKEITKELNKQEISYKFVYNDRLNVEEMIIEREVDFRANGTFFYADIISFYDITLAFHKKLTNGWYSHCCSVYISKIMNFGLIDKTIINKLLIDEENKSISFEGV